MTCSTDGCCYSPKFPKHDPRCPHSTEPCKGRACGFHLGRFPLLCMPCSEYEDTKARKGLQPMVRTMRGEPVTEKTA